jgi:death-on-curing protein
VEPGAVIAFHEELLSAHGGLPGLPDRGKLEAALQRPINLAHYEGVDDVSTLAAAYLIGVAKAHAFSDANKRTAWMTARLFLSLNGAALKFDAVDALRLVVGAADSSVTLDAAAEWFRARLVKR